MKRAGFAVLLLLTVAACSHRQPAPPPPAAVTEDAAFTGLPEYPRALPVKITTTTPVAATNAAPVTSSIGNPSTPVAAYPAGEASPTPAETNAAVKNPTTPAAPPLLTAPTAPTETTAPGADSTTPPSPAAGSTTTPSTTEMGTPAAPTLSAAPLASPDQVAVLDTSFGRIVIELDDFAAPKTCANFRKLVATGFYNGTIFHRVIPQFIIQGGDPNTKGANRASYGQGDPGYTLPPEIKLHHDQGAVAMARLPDAVNPQRYSNGCQFYICVAACPSLDDQYTVFGHVVAGIEVANRIANAPADRRNDPLERISFRAVLESRDQALRDSATPATSTNGL